MTNGNDLINKLPTIKTEAEELLSKMTKELMTAHPEYTAGKAEEEVKMYIGYFAAYFDVETMRRVHGLFDTCHPFLGPNIENMTPTEIMEIGKKMGEASKHKGSDRLRNMLIKPPVKVERRIQL